MNPIILYPGFSGPRKMICKVTDQHGGEETIFGHVGVIVSNIAVDDHVQIGDKLFRISAINTPTILNQVQKGTNIALEPM